MKPVAFGLLAFALLACGERSSTPPPAEDAPPAVRAPAVRAVDALPAEPVPGEVFLRKPVPEAGPGRMMLHVLIPRDATQDQVRQMLTDVLTRAAEEDTTLVAVRAVAYALPQGRTGEVDLVPFAWGEWLPPEGWERATQESRQRFHRVYTYFGLAPEW